MAKPRKTKKITSHTPIQTAAVKILRARLKEFYSHWPDPASLPTPEQLHDLRISGKRLRYSAEALREFYPDRLALLIDLLKHTQDVLGEIQDCVTQQALIAEDLTRLRQRQPANAAIPILEQIIAEYDTRRETLFAQYREIWQGMTITEFRAGLKAMISRVTRD